MEQLIKLGSISECGSRKKASAKPDSHQPASLASRLNWALRHTETRSIIASFRC